MASESSDCADPIMDSVKEIEGLVSAVYGELIDVLIETSDMVAAFQTRSVGTVVVGDRVTLESIKVEEGEVGWRVAGLHKREHCLWRSSRRHRSQLVVANVDRLCIVSALEPPPREGLIDRYLLAAEWQEIEPVILFNKMDLEGADDTFKRLAVYAAIGYEVIPTSAVTGAGIESVAGLLSRGLTVLVGHSGVGKSALLNRLLPEIDLKTAELSQATGKGRHTTSVATAHPFHDGIVVDTPGIREFGLGNIPAEQVSTGFREIYEREGRCRFADCSHRDEPGCSISEAVKEKEITQTRYDSYLRIRKSVETGES